MVVEVPRTQVEPLIPLEEEVSVEVGDRILISFSDEPRRQHTIVISPDRTDASLGIYSSEHALGKALAGAMVDDEVSISMDKIVRKATILGIRKVTEVHPA